MSGQEDRCVITFAGWQAVEPLLDPLGDRIHELLILIPGVGHADLWCHQT